MSKRKDTDSKEGLMLVIKRNYDYPSDTLVFCYDRFHPSCLFLLQAYREARESDNFIQSCQEKEVPVSARALPLRPFHEKELCLTKQLMLRIHSPNYQKYHANQTKNEKWAWEKVVAIITPEYMRDGLWACKDYSEVPEDETVFKVMFTSISEDL